MTKNEKRYYTLRFDAKKCIEAGCTKIANTPIDYEETLNTVKTLKKMTVKAFKLQETDRKYGFNEVEKIDKEEKILKIMLLYLEDREQTYKE